MASRAAVHAVAQKFGAVAQHIADFLEAHPELAAALLALVQQTVAKGTRAAK